MEDNILNVYRKLSEMGFPGTEDEFRQYIQDDSNIKNVYQKLSSEGFPGSEDEFRQYLGGDSYVAPPAPSRVDVSDVEQGRLDTMEMPQQQGNGRYWMQYGKPQQVSVSDKVNEFADRYNLQEKHDRMFEEGRPAIEEVDGKVRYNFSPENLQGMRSGFEDASTTAMETLDSLMPDIERSIRERALFETEQNNRNKDASPEMLQYHADQLAEHRIKLVKDKLEKEGVAGMNADSINSMLSFGDEALKGTLSAAFQGKEDIERYMDAYYKTPEGIAERVAGIERSEQAVQAVKDKRGQSFWSSVGGMLGDMAISGAMEEGGMSYADQEKMRAVQDDIRKRSSVNMALNQQIHEAENTLNIAKKNIAEGEGGAATKLGRGIRYSNLDGLVPMSDLYGSLGILQLYEKLDENGRPKVPLTEDEKNLYEALAANQYVQQTYSGDMNMLNRIGQGMPEQAAFTLSFLLSSEFAGAQALGMEVEKGVRRGISKAVKKEVGNGVGRFMLDKVLPKAVGMGVETAYRTGLQPGTIAGNAIGRHVGTLSIDPETGEVGGFEGGVDWGEAVWKAVASTANENLTELLGDQVFQPGWEWLGRNTKAGKAVSDFRKGLGELGDGKVDDILKMGGEIRRKAGWAGWSFETLEEMAGNFNDAAFIHDQTWKDAFSKETVMETTLNCMVFGMVMGGTTTGAQALRDLPSTVSTRNEKRKAAAVIDGMDGISTAEIDDHIDNDTSNGLADWLVERYKAGNSNGDWTDAQRAAVANYVKASITQKAQRHYKGMQMQEDVKAMEDEVDAMTNSQTGDVIEATFNVDGQQMEGAIVGGRVSVAEEETAGADGTPTTSYIFNPNLSSVTVSVRTADGEAHMIPSRDVTGVTSVRDAGQYKAERASEIESKMYEGLRQMDRRNSVSDIWGTEVVEGVMLPYNDGVVRVSGKTPDGKWVLVPVNPDMSEGQPFSLDDFDFRKAGMVERMKYLQRQQAQQATPEEREETQQEIEDIADDIETEESIRNVEQSKDENNIWDAIAGFMQDYFKTNEEGDFVVDESQPGAAAAYLVALQNGDIARAVEVVEQRIAELQARVGQQPQAVQNNGEGVTTLAAEQGMADNAAEEARKQIGFLTAIRDGLVAKQQEKARMDSMKPVSQMAIGQSFPVQWNGQPAIANVVFRDADGRSVVSVVDMNGEPLEVGIDDWTDEQWDAVRTYPQNETQPEPQPVPVQPTPQGPAPSSPTGGAVAPETEEGPQALAPQPVSQNETPEPSPIPPTSDVAPSMEFPRDEEGNIDYGQITDPYVYAAAAREDFGDDVLEFVDALIEGEEEALEEAKKIKDTVKRFREQRDSKARLERFRKVKEILTTPQGQAPVEQPTEGTPATEAPVTEQPAAEVPVEEAPAEEVPAEEVPAEVRTDGMQPEEEPKDEEPANTVDRTEKKPKPKEQTEYQKRLDAVGEPRTLEEAILLDIARGGRLFRWGKKDRESKKVLKRGIGDLWSYDESERKRKFQMLSSDGYTVETYAEAIMQGQLQALGGAVSQIAERMDYNDIIAAIEDVLQMVNTPTQALEAIEAKRAEEEEEELNYIKGQQDREARLQNFEDYDDMEAYYNSLSENNLTDDEYNDIIAIFAEQYQERNGRKGQSETTGGTSEQDERAGVRGEDKGGGEILQGEQPSDEGTNGPTRQGEGGERGDTAGGTPQGAEPEGAAEIRAEIERLKAQRASIVKQRDDLQKRYEKANGLFGDTQADENDLFGGQNFLSPELAQTTIDGYNRQIANIDNEIARLEASLRHASNVKQTEIEDAAEVAPQDIEVSSNPAATETFVEKGLTEEEIDAAEGIDNQTKLLAKEYVKGNKNELTKDAYEEVREYYAERGRGNSEQDGGAAGGTQLAAADNETPDGLGGGQRGAEPERMGQRGSEEAVPGERGRSEDGTQRPAVPSGEEGTGNGGGTEPGTAGQPVVGGDAAGGGGSRGNGPDVRGQGREETGGKNDANDSGRGNQAPGRRSTAEIDKDISDTLAELGNLFKNAVERSRRLGIAETSEQQAREDVAWFRSVRKAIFKLAGYVFERGYNQFDEWRNKIKEYLHGAIKNFKERLSDERLEQLLTDAWECPFEYNGEVKTIREWASELHAAEVRKMLNKTVAEKRKEQEEANKKHIKNVHGDIDNIREALPFLLPHQHENVARAERQFFSEEHADRDHGFGKGYCFTDGTGTGKTFTGLGIARRFVNEGKGRILILTTASKVDDWVSDAAKLGLEVESLESVAKKEDKTATRVKGKGIVCTTYANASQNLALLEDVFDLVIYDESHYIMNNKKGEATIGTKTHYMLTNKNVESALERLKSTHPLWITEKELKEERQRNDEILGKEETTREQKIKAQERISQIDGQLKQIESQQKAELPAMRQQAYEASKVTKAVFLSATPFKTVDNLEYAEGYIFSYPEEDQSDIGSPRHKSGKDEFKLRFFGSMYRWRNNRVEDHVQSIDAAVQQQQDFADRLMTTLGTMSGNVLDNGYDYSRHFPLVEVAMADQFNEAVEALNRDPAFGSIGQYFPFNDYDKMSILFETMKASAIIPRIQAHLDSGRKVIIFNRRTNINEERWTPQNPFTYGLAMAREAAKNEYDRDRQMAMMEAIAEFSQRFASLIAWADTLDYRLPSEQLHDAFGDRMAVINGSVTGKKRTKIIERFNGSDSGLDIILGQERTMREGISCHDTKGDRMRVEMTLALPQETTTFLQGEGRIYRIGNKSNAVYEYPLLGINKELTLFALRFNAAVGMTENLAMGSSARNLARSIARGVVEDSGVVPLEEQGTGGREKDYAKNTRDAYSQAINDYYSQQKQNAGREDRLGKDYYATPEPLGFKMVQWLNLAEGEEVLEPSAGHGAIARYFPGNVRSLAIEPSDALFSMLALNTGGVDKDDAAQSSGKNRFVRNGNFEDLNEVNKYDAIAMNPPFGTAGKTAIEHLDKAWKHLNNSGRLAIIVPTGAMDKKMEDWLESHKDAVVVGEVKLPAVTFEKAGTHVMTRMLLIDKARKPSFRRTLEAKKVTVDMTGIQNIDELFQQLRDMDMPSRMIDPSTKLHRHGEWMRAKLVSNDMVPYRRNEQTGRRGKNNGKAISITDEGIEIELDPAFTDVYNINLSSYQNASWNDIKKLRGRWNSVFSPSNYVYLSDVARCDTMREFIENGLGGRRVTQEKFDAVKDFAENVTEFVRRVTGFTDEQIRDYNAKKIDLFDYAKMPDNAKLTFQDLSRRYEDMEPDPMLQALFERVAAIADRIGMKIETFGDPYSNTVGTYNPLTNTLRINSGRWNESNDDAMKSRTILHELIHSVTTYALNAYEKGASMPDGLKDACRRLIEIYENLKGDYVRDYGNTKTRPPYGADKDVWYGFSDPHEMIAEMANPTFRKYLQKKSLWTKFKDGIKRVLNYLGLQNLGVKFGNTFREESDIYWYGSYDENVKPALEAGWKPTNAFDELSEVLDAFLDNFDAAMYERRNDGVIMSNVVEREEENEADIQMSVRTEPAPKKTGIGYKVFVLRDGKLYPPMVANPNGEATPVGVWLDADAAPVVGTTKTGRQQVKAGGKGTQGGSGQLSYRPGWHLGEIPYATQFNRKDENGDKALFPKNFVWAEVEYAEDVDYQDEAMEYGKTKNGGFNNALAGLPRIPKDGSYRYRTNPNPQTDPWIITGAMKVNRILTPSEVDDMVREAGREPQQREKGAVTDEQVNRLNESIKNSERIAFDAVSEALGRCGIEVRRATEKDMERLRGKKKTLTDSKGTVRGWEENGVIYLTEDGMDAETPIHEYTHIWVEAIMKDNPELWEQIKGLLKDTPVWKEVTGMKEYSDLKDEDRIASEVLSRISGRENGRRMEEEARKAIEEAPTMQDAAKAASVLNRLKEALKKFWTWCGKKLAGKKGRVNIEQVQEMILADLLNGVNPDNPGGRSGANASVETEMEQIKKDAVANGTFMKAPNGKKSNLDERQWLQVRTQAFKDWFGDWENDPENASKVVDENGEPLVLYHGTDEDFTVFRRFSETGVRNRFDEIPSEYFLFTDDEFSASEYGEPMPLFLNAKNVFYANSKSEVGRIIQEKIDFINEIAPADFNLNEYNVASFVDEFVDDDGRLFVKSSRGVKESTECWAAIQNAIAEYAEENGYDGFLFNDFTREGHETIGVFNSNQAKSATNNNGEFSESDDINLSVSAPQNRIADEYNRMTGARVDGVNGIKRGWEAFARGQLDEMRPLEQLQKVVEKALGRKLRDSERAYELATQLVSKSGRQIEQDTLDYVVPMMQNVTAIVRDIMDDKGISMDEAMEEVGNYLLAKHGLERNAWFLKKAQASDPNAKERDKAGLRGLASHLKENPDNYNDVAEMVVSDFEDSHDTDALWDSIKALTDRMLEISYNTGMIDKDMYEELKSRHTYYVPLRGFAEGTASDLFDYVTQSPVFQNIFKEAHGRKSMADDPLSNMVNMLHSAIVIGNQNEVMQKIYNMAVNSKSDLLRVTKPWYVYNDAKDVWEETFPDIPEYATADEIDAIVKQFEADMEQLKADGKAKRILNRLELGKKVLAREAKEHRMIAYVAGRRVAMHVAGNPLVAQAMNRANAKQFGKVMRGVQAATRWYSSINTSWSPAFGPKNAMRDIRFMLFSSFVTGGLNKTMRSLRNIIKATWVLPRLIVTGKMDGGLKKMLNPQDAAQLEQWWNEFLENGGETGFTRTLSAEKAKADLRGMVKNMLKGNKDGESRIRKYTLGLLEEFGRYSEDISRFAAYCQQRAQGGSVLGSINEAKNVTVNFNVHGGSDLAASMRALYSFFNASMQGINRMRRLATEHPGRFSVGIGAMMLGGAILPWLNMAMFALLGGDDDDWRKYEHLSEYTANHNMVLYVGDHKFVSIPWSQELAPFNALGNIWFRQQMGWNNGRSVADQWADMFVELLPVEMASGRHPAAAPVKTVFPSFTLPVWEALFNEDFTTSPIYRDNQWNKYDRSWEKAYEGKTSRWVIDASRWLDQKTGVDINPAIAEHLFSGVLGGLGRSGDKLLRFFSNGFQLQDAPFLRTMMFDSNPKGYIGAVQREYGNYAYEVMPRMKHDVERMTALEYAAVAGTEEYKVADVVSKYKTGKDLNGEKVAFHGIDKMEREYKKLAAKSDGSEGYRERLQQLKLEITEMKMEMLDEIQQVRYEYGSRMRKDVIDTVKEFEERSKAKAKGREKQGE